MTRVSRDPEAVACLERLFRDAPPEWQELFAELDRRDPSMSPVHRSSIEPKDFREG